MKILMFVLLFGSLIISCKESDKRFAVGDCVNAVDGSEVWKLDSVEPLKGKTYSVNGLSETSSPLPSGRIFAEVPCPQ